MCLETWAMMQVIGNVIGLLAIVGFIGFTIYATWKDL